MKKPSITVIVHGTDIRTTIESKSDKNVLASTEYYIKVATKGKGLPVGSTLMSPLE